MIHKPPGFTIGDNTSLDFGRPIAAATPGDQDSTEGQQFIGSLLTWTQDAATGLWNALVYVQATLPTRRGARVQVTVNEVANPTALPADQRSSTSASMTAVVPFVPDYSTPDNSGLDVATGADGGIPVPTAIPARCAGRRHGASIQYRFHHRRLRPAMGADALLAKIFPAISRRPTPSTATAGSSRSSRN